jgi:hypothetical protein
MTMIKGLPEFVFDHSLGLHLPQITQISQIKVKKQSVRICAIYGKIIIQNPDGP